MTFMSMQILKSVTAAIKLLTSLAFVPSQVVNRLLKGLPLPKVASGLELTAQALELLMMRKIKMVRSDTESLFPSFFKRFVFLFIFLIPASCHPGPSNLIL